MASDKVEVREKVAEYGQMSPSQIALALAHLSRELQRLQDEQEPLETSAVQAREKFTLEYSKAWLAASGNNEEKKQRATYSTHQDRLEAETAEVLVKMHVGQVATLRKRVEIARSAAALVRAEWELMQAGGRARGG